MLRQIAFCRSTRRMFATEVVSEIKNIGVIGIGGLMGHGIAQQTSMAKIKVVGIEQTQAQLSIGKDRIANSLTKLSAREVKKGTKTESEGKSMVDEAMSMITFSTRMEDIKQCDLVVEAIIEKMDIKLPLYKSLNLIVKPSAILASNTSSLSITQMAEASGRPDRVVGLHFFNPVQIMKLVEIVGTKHSTEAVLTTCKAFIAKIGRQGVVCQDTPGFIVNRLIVPFMAEAMNFQEESKVNIGDIDVSMMLGASHPMGPFTLADYVGLDTTLSILEGWNDSKRLIVKIPRSLREKVKAGLLGRKSGKGFYYWNGDTRGELVT